MYVWREMYVPILAESHVLYCGGLQLVVDVLNEFLPQRRDQLTTGNPPPHPQNTYCYIITLYSPWGPHRP
jgi:hypothetical protein